jgi:aminoacylase
MIDFIFMTAFFFLKITLGHVPAKSTHTQRQSMSADNEADVALFKEFLRINTMHPSPDLSACVKWLERFAVECDLSIQQISFVPGLPVVILTQQGTDPSLPAVGLNCHMDVVPVVAERWDKLPSSGETPFSAWEDTDGKIYARGSQDMKCVGAQYLCALRHFKRTGVKLLRTVHTIWVPDEEIGGEDGMKRFVTSDMFRSLNLGVVMDEGLAFIENKFVVFTGERTAIWARLAAAGPVGHASKLIPDTAIDRLSSAIRKLSTIRSENVHRLEADSKLALGDVTTVNITVLHGGTTNDGGKTYAPNVIPSDAFLIADIRVALEDYNTIVQTLKDISREEKLELTFQNKFEEKDGPSPYSDRNSVWMRVIEDAIRKTAPDAEVERAIFPAATDSRYVRRVGLPSFGFSPMRRTPSLLHDHNEYLERSVYLEGVNIMTALVHQLASVPAQPGHKL